MTSNTPIGPPAKDSRSPLQYLSLKYQEFFGRPQKSSEIQISESTQNIAILNSVDEVRFPVGPRDQLTNNLV